MKTDTVRCEEYKALKLNAELLQPLAEQLKAVNRLKNRKDNSSMHEVKHLIEKKNSESQEMEDSMTHVPNNINNLNIDSQEGLNSSAPRDCQPNEHDVEAQ